MPVHLHAQPGDYAQDCLLPGDPLRARRVAERLLADATEVNSERGLLGFTGSFGGTRVSVQATGMGGPSAAIVLEELALLGVTRVLRTGTCGALREQLGLGELVLALSAIPADGTSVRYTGGEPHAPTSDWELLHSVVHAAKGLGRELRVGPVVSTDLFYEPDGERAARWARRGALAVEMEAATVFTLASLRGLRAGCLLVVSDLVWGERERIGEAQLATAVDAMSELALIALTSRKR